MVLNLQQLQAGQQLQQQTHAGLGKAYRSKQHDAAEQDSFLSEENSGDNRKENRSC